jgi:hypothetical protein
MAALLPAQLQQPAARPLGRCRPVVLRRSCRAARDAARRATPVVAGGKVLLDPVVQETNAYAPATVANLGPGFDWLGCAVEVSSLPARDGSIARQLQRRSSAARGLLQHVATP